MWRETVPCTWCGYRKWTVSAVQMQLRYDVVTTTGRVKTCVGTQVTEDLQKACLTLHAKSMWLAWRSMHMLFWYFSQNYAEFNFCIHTNSHALLVYNRQLCWGPQWVATLLVSVLRVSCIESVDKLGIVYVQYVADVDKYWKSTWRAVSANRIITSRQSGSCREGESLPVNYDNPHHISCRSS